MLVLSDEQTVGKWRQTTDEKQPTNFWLVSVL